MEELAPEGQRAIHATVPPIRCLVTHFSLQVLDLVHHGRDAAERAKFPTRLICGLLGAVSQARRCRDIVTNCHDALSTRSIRLISSLRNPRPHRPQDNVLYHLAR